MELSMPTAAEELLSQYARTRSPDLRAQIVEAHLSIAKLVARKFSGRGVDYDDLFQVASLALFKGVDRFDPDKGVKFVSFITPTMVGEVKNYFRDRSRAIRLPRRGMEIAARMRAARAALEQELGRSPRLDELAERLQIDEATLLEAMEISGASAPVSLDAQIAEDDEDASFSKFLGFHDAGFAEFERSDQIERAMRALDERQQAVVRLRYMENLSQRDVALRLDISQMTVCRVERQALSRLRELISDGKDTKDTL